jgi:hypothetical protein
MEDPSSSRISPTAGSSAIAEAFDPVGGGGACATTSPADQPDTATYRTAPAPAGGYTLMGSPTVVADITSPGQNSQIAARLLDVDPAANTQTLVARGLWRPQISAGSVRQVFQLHPNGYRFAGGHIAKLELLPKDSPYGRTSNGQENVTVRKLELRLPVMEQPGALGGFVDDPAQKVLPAGYQLARDFQPVAYPRPRGATPVRVPLVPAFRQCTAPNRTHGSPLASPSCGPPVQSSPNLTIGTPDANGNGVNSFGYVLLRAVVGNSSTSADEANVLLTVSLTDVRKAAGLGDYGGELQEKMSLRITDKANGPGGDEAGTVEDFPYAVTVPCAPTDSTGVGSTCSVTTGLDALVPGTVPEGKRSIWELGEIQVLDGGPDGVASTADNSLFAVQGVYAP